MTQKQSFKSMCPMNCHPTLCGMTVSVVDGHVSSIVGDVENPDSQGFLCMRGKAAVEIVGNQQRILTPLARAKRGTQDWVETTWDNALDTMATHMRSVGREAVGFWQGHGNWGNDYAFGLKRAQMDRFANLYGCQFWNPAMICWGLGGFGVGITGAIETSTKEDLGNNSELVILWGANTVSQASTLRHVEIAKRRGARVIVVDVRTTEASALAHDFILIRPGTDAALALAMMHVIVADKSWDASFVKNHTVGFDALVEHLKTMTPQWAEKETGVPQEQIISLARSYAAIRPAMIVMGGSSLHKGNNTWQAARAISCLPALTGNFGRPGTGLGPRHGGRSHGAGFVDLSAGDRRKEGRYIPNQMEKIVEALEKGDVKVFVSIGSNILSSFPDTNRMRAALAKAELVVAYDIFPNQMIREVADIVLPGTIWLEEIGAKSTTSYVHLSDHVLPAAGHAKPVFQLYNGLAERLGVKDVYPWANQEDAMNAALDHPATGHTTVSEMRANGGSVALKVSHVAYPTLDFATPSGKIELFSKRAADMGLSPLPCHTEVDLYEQDALYLAHGRTFAHFHAFYDHGRALSSFTSREETPELWISPDDAKARGIGDAQNIEMTNKRGGFFAKARITKRIPNGTVWIRDGWPGLNELTDSTAILPDNALDVFPFSVGQSNFGARVRVMPRKKNE
ncbi:MAG: molybdopterin-dependent oxidoreductase [Roseobacter sp.]